MLFQGFSCVYLLYEPQISHKLYTNWNLTLLETYYVQN